MSLFAFNNSQTALLSTSSPVLLADKEVEGIFCPQKVVIIQDLNRTHPVRIEVTSNLTEDMRCAENREQHSLARSRVVLVYE